jgi:hypothetical protein
MVLPIKMKKRNRISHIGEIIENKKAVGPEEQP